MHQAQFQDQNWLLQSVQPSESYLVTENVDFKQIKDLLYASLMNEASNAKQNSASLSSSSSLSSSYNEIEFLDENVFFENGYEKNTSPKFMRKKITPRERKSARIETEDIVSAKSSSSEDLVRNLIEEIDLELLKNSSNSSHCSSPTYLKRVRLYSRINVCSCVVRCMCMCHQNSTNHSNSMSSSSVSSSKNLRISSSLSPARQLLNLRNKRRHFGSYASLDWDISFDLKQHTNESSINERNNEPRSKSWCLVCPVCAFCFMTYRIVADFLRILHGV